MRCLRCRFLNKIAIWCASFKTMARGDLWKKTNSSLGIQIVEDRISSFNQLYNGNIALKIHDLKEGEAALGTLVQLAFG
jgi:hypothetical protein